MQGRETFEGEKGEGEGIDEDDKRTSFCKGFGVDPVEARSGGGHDFHVGR